MQPLGDALAHRYPVYAPDLPGFGRSAAPPTALDIGGLAESLSLWMTTSGIDRAVLIANSLGCQTTCELAARRSQQVESLVLIGPTTDSSARNPMRQLVRWLRNAPREPPSLALIIARDYWAAGLRRPLQTFRASLRDDLEAKLPEIAAPTLIIRGERDAIAPQEWVKRVASLLPDSECAVVAGAAHTANYSSPSAVAALVERYLDRRAPAAQGP